MAITRNDVARVAGVSTATVSYVINNGPRPVATDTRKKVLDAIQQLNYQPNLIARSLKTRQTNTACILITDILNPVLASIERSIEEMLLARNYSLKIGNSDESIERERKWLQFFSQRSSDGIILLPTGGNFPLIENLVNETKKHLVLIDREMPRIHADTVIFDNEGGAYSAVSHLILAGHKRIGFLNLPAGFTPGKGRLSGYRKALMDAGLPFSLDLVSEGSFKSSDSSEHVNRLFNLKNPPTAIFVGSNRLAQGVLHEIKLRKLRMPDDLALVVFDDVPYYFFFNPSISAVSMELNDFSKSVVEFLIERIHGTYTGEARLKRIPCNLIIRESSGGTA